MIDNQYTDVMLDLETFGTGTDAAIVSIGAVAFNADGDNDALWTNTPDLLANIGMGFRLNVDLTQTLPEQRGSIDPATVMWWLTQSEDARRSITERPGFWLGEAIHSFTLWVSRLSEKPSRLRLWSNGPTFDETILRSAFRRYNRDFPISFRGSRCCRTMIELAESFGWRRIPSSEGQGLVAHDALSDAVRQAREVVSQREHLRRARLG